MLIGYIPTSRLEGIGNKAARRRAVGNVFHFCMRNILAPITSYGETGIAMMSGDGISRRCHPILTAFVGDYPEQVLVSCTYSHRCPKCNVRPDRLGDYSRFPPRDYDEALETFHLADGDVHVFHSACRNAGLKPVFHPFWEALPLTDIFVSITPDILHQMLQGVMKHLISWVTNPGVFGPAPIDARCRSLPPNHNILTFAKGISSLSRVTGLEHQNMCRILLGLVMNLPLPSGEAPSQIIRATRALLDFLFLAQLPSHTTNTLVRLEESLARFHNNKDVFVDLGIREDFNFPKLHSLLHYRLSITLFGTTDNYNTEQTERLHIDFTKNAYRATNHKDEYPQMTAWLERHEKVEQHALFVAWWQQAQQEQGHIQNTM
jgi:Plavaka transposase